MPDLCAHPLLHCLQLAVLISCHPSPSHLQQPHGAGQGGAHGPRGRARQVCKGAADRGAGAGHALGLLLGLCAFPRCWFYCGKDAAGRGAGEGGFQPEHQHPRPSHASTPSQAIGEDEEELGGYVTTENFLRLRDTSTCGKMQVGRAARRARYACGCGCGMRGRESAAVGCASMLAAKPKRMRCAGGAAPCLAS